MPDYRGLDIPFTSFGKVNSDDLFCEKEQPIFDFYAASADRYSLVLDIGANIGVHTLLMRSHGWTVKAFEPDREIFEKLRENYARNGMHGRPPAELNCAAVSDHDGTGTFIRLHDNRTGSHLLGDKEPFGPLESISVNVVDCRPLFEWADFAKIDCEGHEATLLLTWTPQERCEAMVEVGNYTNAHRIFTHMRAIGRRMWAQKLGWKEVEFYSDMPTHHSQGALFIGEKGPFA